METELVSCDSCLVTEQCVHEWHMSQTTFLLTALLSYPEENVI
jgi:hypothetical protein